MATPPTLKPDGQLAARSGDVRHPKYQEIKSRVHKELLDRLNLEGVASPRWHVEEEPACGEVGAIPIVDCASQPVVKPPGTIREVAPCQRHVALTLLVRIVHRDETTKVSRTRP